MTVHTSEFTKAALLALQPEATRYEVRDPLNKNLVLVVFPTGTRVFYVTIKAGRAHERVKVGPFPSLGVKKARGRAKEIVGEFAGGKNPAQAAREAKRKARAAVPLREAWAAYEAHRLVGADERRKRSVKFDGYAWHKHLAPVFGNRAVDSFDRATVARWFAATSANVGKVAANRLRALLSAILNHWGELVDADVAAGVRRVKKNPEVSRSRYLVGDELRRWWAAVLLVDIEAAELIATLMLTAARHGSLRAMTWDAIDWQSRTWRIPGEAMKSGQPCTLPLNTPALGILRARWERAGRPVTGLVFPVNGGLRGEVRREHAAVTKAAGLADLHPHDYRRCAATAASEAGVDSGIVAHLLGHIDKSVLGKYRLVTAAAAATASEAMARALLAPAGLVPEDFASGLPSRSAMRPEPKASTVLAFRGTAGG